MSVPERQFEMSKKAKAASNVPVPSMRRGVKGFYRDVVREMKHVTWPTPKETTRLTGVVLAVCLLIIVMLQVLTLFFNMILDVIIKGGA